MTIEIRDSNNNVVARATSMTQDTQAQEVFWVQNVVRVPNQDDLETGNDYVLTNTAGNEEQSLVFRRRGGSGSSMSVFTLNENTAIPATAHT